jgi:hypothetical protein
MQTESQSPTVAQAKLVFNFIVIYPVLVPPLTARLAFLFTKEAE